MTRFSLACDTSRFINVEWRQVFTDQSALGWKKTKNSSIIPVVLVRSIASNAVLFDCALAVTKSTVLGRVL